VRWPGTDRGNRAAQRDASGSAGNGDANYLAGFQYTGSRSEITSIGRRVQRDLFNYLKAGQEAPQSVTPQIANGGTKDSTTFADYLQAESNIDSESPEALSHAVEELNAALKRDLNFVLSYVGLSNIQQPGRCNQDRKRWVRTSV
jgi:hypothetical protein